MSPAARSGRTVVLRHQLPDGSGHYDWMFEVPGRAGLVTFRINEVPEPRGPGVLRATPLGDHRAVYLDYEGPVTGGRGSVSRVARGRCAVASATESRFDAQVRLDGWASAVMVRGGPEGGPGPPPGGPWIFRLEPAGQSDILE
ncbi:MAG TPA: hypothetical protein VD963_00655 [Phycisphaerales bacterium]|nr:hypothetical protein [Phycisphaerales bacterium]